LNPDGDFDFGFRPECPPSCPVSFFLSREFFCCPPQAVCPVLLGWTAPTPCDCFFALFSRCRTSGPFVPCARRCKAAPLFFFFSSFRSLRLAVHFLSPMALCIRAGPFGSQPFFSLYGLVDSSLVLGAAFSDWLASSRVCFPSPSPVPSLVPLVAATEIPQAVRPGSIPFLGGFAVLFAPKISNSPV